MGQSAIVVRLGLLYAAIFLVTGASLPFIPAWLAAQGLSGAEVGLAIGAGMMARLVVGLLAGYAADRTGSPRGVLMVSALALALIYALHLVTREAGLLMVLTALAGAAAAPLTPVTESLAVAAARAGTIHYGRVRSIGSAAFVLANVLLGAWVARAGDHVIMVWLLLATGVLVLAAAQAPRPHSESRSESQSEPGSGGARSGLAPLLALLTPPMMAAFAASALVQGSHAFYYGFSTLTWTSQGVSPTVIGLLWAWGVIAEIILLSAFAARLERLGPARLVGLAAISGLVRWSALAFVTHPALLFALQTLHAGTFAAGHLGFIVFARASIPQGSAATAQSLNSALTMGGALAGASWASGVLFTHIGPLGYLAMSGLSLLALGGAVLMARFERGPKTA